MKLFVLAACLVVLVKVVKARSDTFYYFAYGSNLLAKRIHINNPTAKFFSQAVLLNHRLDFNMYATSWRGAVATIVPDPENRVWGALWTIKLDHLKHLDKQEGVDKFWYYPKIVNVTLTDDSVVEARTYQETAIPPKTKSEDIPMERRPSNTYMQVIIDGAIESGLPPEYLAYLNTFPTNGKVAKINMLESLGYLPQQ